MLSTKPYLCIATLPYEINMRLLSFHTTTAVTKTYIEIHRAIFYLIQTR